MKLKLILITFLFLIFPLSGQELYVMAVDYPPFTDQTGDGYGMSFEIISAAFENSRFTVKPVFFPPARCELDFKSGKYPVSLYNNLSFQEKANLKQILIQRVSLVFYYNSEIMDFQWTELSDLKEKSVGFLRANHSTSLRSYLAGIGVRIVEVNSMEQAFQMLTLGRIDLTVSVDLTAINFLNSRLPGSNSIKQAEKAFMEIEGGPWFNFDHPDGEAAYQAYKDGKKRIIDDGTLLNILEKYYGRGMVPDNTIIY
ncbi:MAG: transporter substrate-binding domain-containing protein [Spirochaetales bacterium]|nr:transporter substrate-binding domain-containing protein [Spirochaetales bacterium]